MSAISTSFTGTTTGAAIQGRHRSLIDYVVAGTFVATVILERSRNGGLSWETVLTLTAPGSGALDVQTPDGSPALYRFRCTAFTSGTAITDLADSLDLAESRIVDLEAKIGGTAGWVLGGGAINTGLMATLPASQTASKLIVPIPVVKAGDVIVGFHLSGQIESAGATATLDADLRRHVAAAADPTDTSLGAITQIVATAQKKLDRSNSRKILAAPELVTQDATYYVVLTGTTAALTDLALMGVVVLVQKG